VSGFLKKKSVGRHECEVYIESWKQRIEDSQTLTREYVTIRRDP
jgi:hypothetical protein